MVISYVELVDEESEAKSLLSEENRVEEGQM